MDVARAAGVSDAWLSKVENNLTQTPSPKMLRAIARPLQVRPDDLLMAAGYLVDPVPVEKMTRTDILDQVDRLMSELRRREAHRRDDAASGRRQYLTPVGGGR
jgi:transcriptional regulator with XRE-family HTH domain